MLLEFDIPGAGPMTIERGQAGATIQIPRETEHVIYRERALRYPRFWDNLLGLYHFENMDGLSEKNISDFNGTEYNISPDDKACVWEPTKGIDMNTTKVRAHQAKVQNELCADAFWGAGWRALLGKGAGRHLLNDNPDSQKLIAMAIDKQHNSIGNDYWKQIEFGGNPIIDLAEAGSWYANKGMTADTFERLKKQQNMFGGHVTIMQGLQAEGQLDGFSIQIDEADTNGRAYTGDVFKLIDQMEEKMPYKLGNIDGRITKMTPGIFKRFKEQLSQRHRGTDFSYTIDTTGNDGKVIPIKTNPSNVIHYDGNWYVRAKEWEWLDTVFGTKTHMIGCFAPKTLIVPYDISPQEQFNGMGMRIHYSELPKDFGKTYMWGFFKTGAALRGQNDWIAFGSLVLPPK